MGSGARMGGETLDFAALLNRYLDEQERTGRWLARHLEVDPGAVSRWRSGVSRPRDPRLVLRAADLLGIFEPHERCTFLTAGGVAPGWEVAMGPPPTHDDPPPATSSEASQPTAPFSLAFFREALQAWSDGIFRWSAASDHMRSSWAGLAIHALGSLTERVRPQGVLTGLVALALWALSAWLLAPTLHWPLGEEGVRRVALLKYGIGAVLVPLLLALVTRPDGYDRFDLRERQERATLWFLKVTGALVGYNVFACITLGVALGWYYLGQPPLPPGVRGVLVLVPLFWGYVVARRIPLDRHKLFEGALRAHAGDPLFLGMGLLFGPCIALALHQSYWFFAHRVLGPGGILIAVFVVALLEARRGRAEKGMGSMADETTP